MCSYVACSFVATSPLLFTSVRKCSQYIRKVGSQFSAYLESFSNHIQNGCRSQYGTAFKMAEWQLISMHRVDRKRSRGTVPAFKTDNWRKLCYCLMHSVWRCRVHKPICTARPSVILLCNGLLCTYCSSWYTTTEEFGSTVNHFGLYSGGVWFESGPVHRLLSWFS